MLRTLLGREKNKEEMSDEQIHIAQLIPNNLPHNQNDMTIISLFNVNDKKLTKLQRKTD